MRFLMVLACADTSDLELRLDEQEGRISALEDRVEAAEGEVADLQAQSPRIAALEDRAEFRIVSGLPNENGYVRVQLEEGEVAFGYCYSPEWRPEGPKLLYMVDWVATLECSQLPNMVGTIWIFPAE